MSSSAGVEGSRRRRWRFLLVAKVAVVVGLLLLANLAVGWGGLHAVAVTNRQADELYNEYLHHVRDQSDLSRALDQAYQDALQLIPTNSALKQVEIGGRLDQGSIPAVQRALEVVERNEADEQPSVRALLQRVRDGWQRFLKLRRSGRFEVIGDSADVARSNDALVDETARIFAPMLAAVDQLTGHEFEHAQQAHDRANSTYRSSTLLIAVILVGSLAAAIAVGLWLTRDIVRRIRDYAAFATKVTDGAALRDTLRESDFVGRYGGEEFLLLLPNTDRAGATVVAETIRAAIELVKVPGVERAITASLGIAVTPDDADDPTKLIRNADKALFTAKARGRNRVEGGTDNLDDRASGRRRSEQPASSHGDKQTKQTEEP